MKSSDPIFVAGHRGMVGAALVRLLKSRGFSNLLIRTRAELDLRDTKAVVAFYESYQPKYVFTAAARVGGILANSARPVEFLSENLQIELNVINGAGAAQVKKLLFLGSSCIYPKMAAQPLQEESLLTGPLEPTNEAYALAKICGVKLCEAYRRQYGADFFSVMPTNLYGPEDNFDLQNSHVLPALIRRFHEARESQAASVTLWGTGTVFREFLHVDDLAEACLLLMEADKPPGLINVGSGHEIRISELAALVAKVVKFSGRIEWDGTKPDGTPRKLLDVTKMSALGWRAKTDLEAGIRGTYVSWLKAQDSPAQFDEETLQETRR